MLHIVQSKDGVKLNTIAVGNPQNPCLLLIHGYSQNSLVWLKQLQSKELKNFYLIAFDLRGHGFSEKPNRVEDYVNDRFSADDLNAIIKYFNLKKVVK